MDLLQGGVGALVAFEFDDVKPVGTILSNL
jgi:hypothetical protein